MEWEAPPPPPPDCPYCSEAAAYWASSWEELLPPLRWGAGLEYAQHDTLLPIVRGVVTGWSWVRISFSAVVAGDGWMSWEALRLIGVIN